MKKIILFCAVTFILVSCSQVDENISENGKQDFFVDVQNFAEFSNQIFLEKSGKIQSGQDIKLASQANGRIRQIHVKEGDKVSMGQTLVTLNDNVANYSINLQKADNLLEKMEINYDSTELSLNKQVFDAQINLEKLENNLTTLKRNLELDVEQAKDSLDNSVYNSLDSRSALELQKLDNSIEKAELDYSNSLNSNELTIEGYKSTLKKEHNALLISLADSIEFGDKLFGISEQYEDEADNIRDYLGGEDSGQRYITEGSLSALIEYKKTKLEFAKVNDVSSEELIGTIDIISEGYDLLKRYLNNLEETLNNSIPSEGTLGRSEIDAYLSVVNAYQSSLQISYATFLSFDTAASSFLKTYLLTQSSLEKQINILKKDREIFISSLESSELKSETGLDKVITSGEDGIKTLELQIELAKENLSNAQKAKDVTLRSLQNSIDEAQINLSSAQREYGKLTITAPIDGVIGDILGDVGQDVAIGTSLVNIVSSKKTELEISFKDNELSFVSVGTPVYMAFNNKTYTGSIYSLSPIADQNLSYKSNIVFPEKLDLIGGIAKVRIPVKSVYKVVPLNSLTISGNNVGLLHTLSDSKINPIEVKLGNVYGENIEVISMIKGESIGTGSLIILSDISNFDPEKFNLKVAQ